MSCAYFLSYHKNSNGPWVGKLYHNQNFKGDFETVYSDYLMFPKMFPSPFPATYFSINWSSCFILEKEALVTFLLESDDGSRLFVNGEKVIDNWSVQSRKLKAGTANLKPGKHLIEVSYFQGKARSSLVLKSKIGDKEISYFGGNNLKQPKDCS